MAEGKYEGREGFRHREQGIMGIFHRAICLIPHDLTRGVPTRPIPRESYRDLPKTRKASNYFPVLTLYS